MTCQLYIDTCYENASCFRWELVGPDTIRLDVIPDHERFSPNMQFTHLNFRLNAQGPLAGRRVRFLISKLNNCWNGRVEPAVGAFPISLVYRAEGGQWKSIPGTPLNDPLYALSFEVPLEASCMQIARMVPYTETDLNRTLAEFRNNRMLKVYNIGATVEGRALEMLELGDPTAPRQVFLRARAHPWEPGGNWLLEGLIRYMCSGDRLADEIGREVCFCLMPMANKDGVWRGLTRYNCRGIDLNRNWEHAEATLAPENVGLQNWFAERQRQHRLPDLAICLHNDSVGRLHPCSSLQQSYIRRVNLLERLLVEESFFREGQADPAIFGGGCFSDGLMEMYGVDALVWELNAEFAKGLGRPPLHTDWMRQGQDFARVMQRYFRSDEFAGAAKSSPTIVARRTAGVA